MKRIFDRGSLGRHRLPGRRPVVVPDDVPLPMAFGIATLSGIMTWMEIACRITRPTPTLLTECAFMLARFAGRNRGGGPGMNRCQCKAERRSQAIEIEEVILIRACAA